MPQWYSGRDGQQYGPFDDNQIRSMIAEGRVLPTDLVWHEGLAQWTAASNVRELYPAGAPPQPIQPQVFGYAPVVEEFRGKAQTAMILSFCGLLCFGPIIGTIAIVFASIAMSGMKRTGNYNGHGMAVTGLIIGIVDVVIGLLYLLFVLGSK